GPDAPYDYGRLEISPQWTHYWAYFQPDEKLIRWITWPELGPQIYHARAPAEKRSQFLDLFENLFTLDIENVATDSALFTNIVEQILIRAQYFTPLDAAPFAESRVNDAKEYILGNLCDPFSVGDVADHVKLSRARLSDLFKRTTGQTIIEWRDEHRLAAAVQMLLHSDLSIAAIADEIGFTDPLYFSRKFKASMGESPRSYRASRCLGVRASTT
ncbi:MAG: AraC family transcriptional regulator, partial [Pseudomonadota bacterium]